MLFYILVHAEKLKGKYKKDISNIQEQAYV